MVQAALLKLNEPSSTPQHYKTGLHYFWYGEVLAAYGGKLLQTYPAYFGQPELEEVILLFVPL